MRTLARSFAILSSVLSLPALAQNAPAPSPSAPPAPPASQADSPDAAPAGNSRRSASTATPIQTADDLLNALETADKDLTTLESDLVYTKTPNELVGGSAERRNGKLWFFSRPSSSDASAPVDAKPQPDRLFQVEFLTLELDGTRREDRQVWIFDGVWLVEKNFKTRLLHRRQVVRPGEKADPLAIGEGPLPIPIGQKRAKILERFEATLSPTVEGAPELAHKLLTETLQLRLKPKAGTQEARDYREVRIWYRKDDLLPRLARATHKDGSVTEILLTDMKVNKDLSEAVFDTRLPEGWNEQVDNFRQAKNADE